MSDAPGFAYSNLDGRRPSRFLATAGLVVPGIARVEAEVVPYAQAWRQQNLAALAGRGPLWVALGDSLTQGVGAPAFDRGWVGQVQARLAAAGHGYRIVNLAVSGARTSDVSARQLPALESLGVAPDLVTLMIGSNDLLRPKNRRGFLERYEALLHRLPAGTVVTSLPNPTRVAAAGNAALARIAREKDLVIAELRDPRTASWRGKLAADHFHPNEAGYAALAAVVGDAILARR